uniref:Endo/exonuclease/phosphatase domain-containing protein n=1 Tax=Glossina austeni TaxID=7395 RepID=A0A1A9UMI1_GLOAU
MSVHPCRIGDEESHFRKITTQQIETFPRERSRIFLMELKILSYNIRGLKENLSSEHFLNYIDGFHIVFLEETHVENPKELEEKFFKNFTIYWKPGVKDEARREGGKKKPGRASGGCMYGIKNDLKSAGITHEFIKGEDILKISTNTLTITFIPLYMRGANWNEHFNKLEKCLKQETVINPIIMGDLNIRIGELRPEFQKVIPSTNIVRKERISKDKKSSSQGRQFIDLCNEHKLIVANGAVEGDLEGAVTFYSPVGSSVNDICALSHNLLPNIRKFSVDQIDGSDHYPIILELNLEGNINVVKKNEEQVQQSYKNEPRLKAEKVKLKDITTAKTYRNIGSHLWLSELDLSEFFGIQNEALEMNEFTALPKTYSPLDTIYNLAAIVHLKFKENERVYALFVTIKAAYLSARPIKSKKRANYEQRFDDFMNDVSEHLEGGLSIACKQIKVLLGEEMIILAEDAETLQHMINDFCDFAETKKVLITPASCKIMIFKLSGYKRRNEKWILKDKKIDVLSRYCYLNMLLTSKMDFCDHVKALCSKVIKKLRPLLDEKNIRPKIKYEVCLNMCKKVFVCYSQCLAYDYEEIDRLQAYLIKRILKLPQEPKAPLHAHLLETGSENWSLFKLEGHLKYITSVLHKQRKNSLTYELSLLVVKRKILWAQTLSWSPNVPLENWLKTCRLLIDQQREKYKAKYLQLQQTVNAFYKNLDYSKGQSYMFMSENLTLTAIQLIFKARCDLLLLNNSYLSKKRYKLCQLCKTKAPENIQHFIGFCPSLNAIRKLYFGSEIFSEQQDIVDVLNGVHGWNALGNYLHYAWEYRCKSVRFKKI